MSVAQLSCSVLLEQVGTDLTIGTLIWVEGLSHGMGLGWGGREILA